MKSFIKSITEEHVSSIVFISTDFTGNIFRVYCGIEALAVRTLGSSLVGISACDTLLSGLTLKGNHRS